MSTRFYKLPKEIAARKDLTATAKIIYAVIADRIGSNGKAWVGYRKLARAAGVDKTTVGEAIGRLQATGEMMVERRGSKRTHLYRLPTGTVREIQSNEPIGVSGKPDTAVRETRTELSGKPGPIETDPLLRPKEARVRGKAAAPPDPRVKTFVEFFCKTYEDTLGRSYIVQWAKDSQHVKKLLQSLSIEELQQATRNMLADSWGRERASLGLLSSQLNTWRGGKAAAHVGRPSMFTPAATGGTDYGALAKKFS